jgi:agmatine deiminase
VLCDDETVLEEARDALVAHGVELARVGLHVVGTDRVWLRDSAPTAVMAPNGTVHWVSWKFNGWAKYDNFARDELIGISVSELSALAREEAVRPDGQGRLVLEGGGIETNGAGALLVTEEWLLSDSQVRNPGLGRADYERAFAHYLGTTRTIWLGEGCVGDDTHGHVDDIARFTDERTIVIAVEEDPADANHARSMDNVLRLELAAKTWPGGLRIVKLPFPRPVTMHDERLPASYANFYIANGVVLVPTFNDRNDRAALNTIAELFPAREVVGIHAVDLVWGLGTLHCLTQQQPASR